MTKRKNVPQSQPQTQALPQTQAAADTQGAAKLWPAVLNSPTPVAGLPVRSLDNIDWMNVTAPVAKKKEPDWRTRMGHDWEARIKSAVMRAWKKQAKFDVLQYVAVRPKTEYGVLMLTPCQMGDEGWTTVRPAGGGAIVRLQTGLETFGLNWPKNEALEFPTFIRETQYGCTLILDVAGKEYFGVQQRASNPKDGEDKKPQ